MVIFQVNRRVLPGRLRTWGKPREFSRPDMRFPCVQIDSPFSSRKFTIWAGGSQGEGKTKRFVSYLTPSVCHCDPEVQCCWQPGIKGFVVVVLEKRYLNTKYNLNKNYGAIVQCWEKMLKHFAWFYNFSYGPQCIAAFVLRKIKKSKEKHLPRTALCSSRFYLFF